MIYLIGKVFQHFNPQSSYQRSTGDMHRRKNADKINFQVPMRSNESLISELFASATWGIYIDEDNHFYMWQRRGFTLEEALAELKDLQSNPNNVNTRFTLIPTFKNGEANRMAAKVSESMVHTNR